MAYDPQLIARINRYINNNDQIINDQNNHLGIDNYVNNNLDNNSDNNLNNNINRCQVILTRGSRRNMECGRPKVRGSDMCSYHKAKAGKQQNQPLPVQDEKKQEEVVVEKKKCMCCFEEMDKHMTFMRFGCSHRYHINCLFVLYQDEYGFIKKPDKCPICDYDSSKEMERECCICLDSLITDIKKLKCGHYYHRGCIGEWDRSKGCPMCRQAY